MVTNSPGVQWREWNDAAFAEARAGNKPVLLDIGAVWCHWCHVMDHGIDNDPLHTGTYTDPDVIARIMADFVPIKVDNDRNPEINVRYNMGGWPSTVFLTPDGQTLYGETYVPPARMIGLLDYIAGLWRDDKDRISEHLHAQKIERQQAKALTHDSAKMDPKTIVQHVVEQLKSSFDPLYGGFGSQPKFPHPVALQFALEQFAQTQDSELQELIARTLDGMAGGGMYDKYAGGFFRYSTQRDWNVPHYEKMLEDNARLTSAYANAATILGEPRYADVVRSAQGWLISDMRDPETSAFAGSQDADAEERYYGQSLAVRSTLPTPFIDRTIYTGWNALMISALIDQYKLTGESELLANAATLFHFLEENLEAEDENFGDSLRYIILSHFYENGAGKGSRGLLTDQTAFIHASLDLYSVSDNEYYLRCAKEAANYILTFLLDRKNGGFFDLPPREDAFGELATARKDITENADAALALIRLFPLWQNEEYLPAAANALACFAEDYKQYGYHAAAYARAVDAASRPQVHVVVVGTRGTDALWNLLQAAWAIPLPGKAIQWREHGDESYPPAVDGAACAYVCVGETCQRTDDPNDPLWVKAAKPYFVADFPPA